MSRPILVALCISLAGCGGSGPETASNGASSPSSRAAAGTAPGGKQSVSIDSGGLTCTGTYDPLAPGTSSRAFVLTCADGTLGTGIVTPNAGGAGATVTFTLTNGAQGSASI